MLSKFNKLEVVSEKLIHVLEFRFTQFRLSSFKTCNVILFSDTI
jgi:hypothetical protein